MNGVRERLDFDGFLEKLDAAISAARHTAHLAGKGGDEAIVRSANESLKQLRSARELIDGPLVWFKIEKGTTYQRRGKGRWHMNAIPETARERDPA